MSHPKSPRWNQPGERSFPQPAPRTDGELYKRPDGDSPEWLAGYEAGFEGRPAHFIGTMKQNRDFADGYSAGNEDREEIDRSGSSNT